MSQLNQPSMSEYTGGKNSKRKRSSRLSSAKEINEDAKAEILNRRIGRNALRIGK